MNYNQRTEAFVKWLGESGVQLSSKIEIADLRYANQGRALVATEDIAEDEKLFELPRSLLMNVENCSLVQDRDGAKEQLMDLPQWNALILVVLYEWKVMGKSSQWFPYFEVLPVNDKENYLFNQLMFWSDKELDSLKPSYIVDRVGKESAQNLFDTMKDLLQDFVGEVTFLEFNDAATLIMSYSFDVEKPSSNESESDEEDDNHDDEDDLGNSKSVRDSRHLKSMVPLADTLNADTRGHNASLMYSDDVLIMRSIKSISKGLQVFNSYSQHPNSEILRRYGYVEANGSAHDFAEISLNDVKLFYNQNDKFDTIIKMLKVIEEDEEESFVLQSYDCFASSEVIFEFQFLVQMLDVILKVDAENEFLSSDNETLRKGIRRIFKKCYQLLESKRVTKGFLSSYQAILKIRLSQYPEEIQLGFDSSALPYGREKQAKIVLNSEVVSLKNCLDVNQVFLTGEDKYIVIEDDKILKNILKKSFCGDEASHKHKKQKSHQ